MLEVVDFKREHFLNLSHNDITNLFIPFITEEHIAALEKTEYAKSFLDEKGDVVICCGLALHWKDRAEAWAMLRSDCKNHMVTIHRTVRYFLDVVDIKRIEAVATPGNTSIRWLGLLGFKRESSLMKNYFPGGESGILYARVK